MKIKTFMILGVVAVLLIGSYIVFKPSINISSDDAVKFLQPKPKERYLQNLINKAEQKKYTTAISTPKPTTTTTLDMCQIVYKTYGKNPKYFTSSKGYCYYSNKVRVPLCIYEIC